MGEFVGAAGTFADVATIYSHLRLPRETAFARVAHADAALQMGDPNLAAVLWRQAKAVQNLPLNDAELNARLAEVEGWIANIQGNASVARDAFIESKRQAVIAFGPDHAKSMEAVSGLIYAERQLHNYERALSLQADLDRIASQVPGRGPRQKSDMAAMSCGS